MAIGAAGGVSIAELIVYIPLLPLAALVTCRHGFSKSSGWIYALVLCLVRIVGSCCQLVSTSNPSKGLLEATLILEFIALSPMMFATLGLLSRAAYWTNGPGDVQQVLNAKVFWLTHILITVSAILCIAGGVGGSGQTFTPDGKLKAGVILYVVSFVVLTAIYLRSLMHYSSTPQVERRLYWAIAAAWPFILVRLLYSVFCDFLHDHLFSVIDGSIAVMVCMSTIEVFLVVLIYVLVGWSLPPVSQNNFK